MRGSIAGNARVRRIGELGRCGAARIDDDECKIRLPDGSPRALSHECLDRDRRWGAGPRCRSPVSGMPRISIARSTVSPRRARNRGDDRDVATGQAIEQARLAYVGRSQEDHERPVGGAARPGRARARDLRQARAGSRAMLRARQRGGNRYPRREVERRFGEHPQLDQRHDTRRMAPRARTRPSGCARPRAPPSSLAASIVSATPSACARSRLAVEEGPLRAFAGLRPSAHELAQREQESRHRGAAMAVQLEDGVSRCG